MSFQLASQKAVTPARGSSVFDSIEKVKSGSRIIPTPTGKSPKERPEPKKRDKVRPMVYSRM